MTALPRLVVAAPASGHGKTTIATGLMAALRAAGHEVSGHKVGPDYIDPGYHSLATGRPGRNLDPHLVGEDLLVPLLLHGARTPRPADVAVVEGVMGLYDGAIGGEGFASTAHVAAVISAPVILVVDISHASRSIAAVVHGMAGFDPSTRIAGVILNKAGSVRHSDEVTRSLAATGVPVLGVIGRDDGIEAPSRHLGLVPAAERPEAAGSVRRLAALVAARVDLAAVATIARGAPDLDATPWAPAAALPPGPHGKGATVTIAGGRAFTFRYSETEELLHAAGCEVAFVDPMQDEQLPAGTRALHLGGGFPEVHAATLAANEPLRRALGAAVAGGVPTVAECAGLLYLSRSVDGSPMVGALEADVRMSRRLTLAYRTAIAPADTLLAPAGTRLHGHEFHRTVTDPGAGDEPAWLLDGTPEGFSADPAGTGVPTVHASYLHLHGAGHPAALARFARAAAAAPTAPRCGDLRPVSGPKTVTYSPDRGEEDLGHHGDAELGAGLVDLAVNVHRGPRPTWLDEALLAGISGSGSYPDVREARRAVAARHGRRVEEVLPTAGGAEAFTLVARMRTWRHPVVVHPQFTEPEAALRAAGYDVARLLLDADAGFVLDPGEVAEGADLVVLGNPTNPTSVLHPAATVRALLRPGRLVVVDEAFMDAVPGERESLAGTPLPGLAVVRSLTKTWAIPGIRAGYVVAGEETVDAMSAQQSPWSVSSPAAASMVACSSAEALAEAHHRAHAIAEHREILTTGLRDLGIDVAGPARAPFVLARPGPHAHPALRSLGFAARRCDTFPGLGPEWIRLAVRDPATTRRLLAALATIVSPSRTSNEEGSDVAH